MSLAYSKEEVGFASTGQRYGSKHKPEVQRDGSEHKRDRHKINTVQFYGRGSQSHSSRLHYVSMSMFEFGYDQVQVRHSK